MDTSTIVTLFKFKRWADTETLQAIQGLMPQSILKSTI